MRGCHALKCFLNSPVSRGRDSPNAACAESTHGPILYALCYSTLTVQPEVPVSLPLMEMCTTGASR